MIDAVEAPEYSWLVAGGADQSLDEAWGDTNDYSVVSLGGFAWTAPPYCRPVLEGWLREGYLWQPVVLLEEEGYVDYMEAAVTGHRLALRLARVDLTDPDDFELLDISPAASVISGRFNPTAEHAGHHDDPDVAILYPWGTISHGGRLLGVHREGAVIVPRMLGSLSVYAIDTETGARAWERRGDTGYPSTLANMSPATALSTIDNPARADLDFSIENYTVLGPGRPGTILVRRVSRDFVPEIYPNWDRSYASDVRDGNGDLQARLHGSWEDQWVIGYGHLIGWEDLGYGYNTDPLFHPDYPVTAIAGTPGYSNGPAPGPFGFYPSALSAIAMGPTQCLADAQAIADSPHWQASHLWRRRVWIEEWDLATGETLSSYRAGRTATTGDRGLNGYGDPQLFTYPCSSGNSWPEHPDEPSWPGNEYMWRIVTPEPREGYVGGTYDSRSIAPHTILRRNEEYLESLVGTAAHGYTGSVAQPGPGLLSRRDYDVWAGSAGVFHVVHCYTPLRSGETGEQTIDLALPFSPLSYATDGRVAIFAPHRNTAAALSGKVAPGGTLPNLNAESAVGHMITCMSLGPNPDDEEDEAPPFGTILWTVDTRALLGPITLSDGRDNARAGDSLSHPYIRGDRVYLYAMGGDGQRAIMISLASGAVLAQAEIGPSPLSDAPAVATGSLVVGRDEGYWRDNLVDAGGRLCGLVGANFWSM